MTAFTVAMLVGAATVEGKLVSAGSSDAPSTDAGNKHSVGIAEVLKMVDAGVPKDVIKAYIDNSPVAYRPNADEIIALNERGVSREIITALLRRGGELKSKAAQAAQPVQSPPAQSAPSTAVSSYAPAASYAPAPQPVYQDYSYPYSYPVYSYATYPSYSYASPYFYSSFSYYPYFNYRSCYPSYRYQSCYPRYGYGSSFAQYGYRSCNSGYGYRGSYARSGGFHAGYSSTCYAGAISPYRHGGFRAGYSSTRPSGGFASSRPGGGSSGRRH